MNNRHSQLKSILAALQAGETLTHLEAEQRFGCARLAARIGELRAGDLNHIQYDIDTIWVRQNGKRFARYVLKTPRLRIIEAIPAFPPVETNQQQLF
jgi:integrase